MAEQGYMGNKHLPTIDATFEYTPEQYEEIEKCKASMLYFAENYFYIIDPDEGKVNINLYDVQKKILAGCNDNRFNILLSPRQAGKRLDCDELIPSPSGYLRNGDLKDGDVIYGQDGNPCNVVKAWDIVEDSPTYEIEFDNGVVMKACSEHLWFAQTKTHREKLRWIRRKGSTPTEEELYTYRGEKYTTEEMFSNFMTNTKNPEPFYRIPSCVNGVSGVYDDSLPIEPYTFGLWLGDGNSDGMSISVDNIHIDEQLLMLSERNPHLNVYKGKTSPDRCGIIRLSSKHDKTLLPRITLLKEENLYNNKHIPDIYLLASRDQRLELMRGLIDSDGDVSPRGECVFSQMNEMLARQVQELAITLGYKATFRQKMAKIGDKEYGMCSYVSFYPREKVAYLSHKSDRIEVNDITYPENNKRNQWHYIKDIRPCKSVPMRCITVDSPDSLYLVGKTHIPTSNTTLMTIAALHEACFFNHKSIIIAANKEATAAEIFKRVRLAYEELPNWLKPATVEYQKTSATFGNGSSIGITATTTNAIRGKSLNMLIIDEMAFLDSHIVDEFWKAVYPTISRSSKSKVVVASTPNGKGNLFYKLYADALAGTNGFYPHRIEWNDIPGRDEEWREEQIAALGSLRSFLQEFDNTFLDDGSSTLNEELFAEMKMKCLPPKGFFMDDCYKVWKSAAPQDRLYVAGVDIAEGVGRDASVIQIFDITDLREIEQVAIYHNNRISPYEFADVCYEILEQWGLPPALVERNAAGVGVVERLFYDYKYPKLVAWGADSANAKGTAGTMGIRANQNSKYKGVVNQRYYINELRAVTFRDIETLEEFKTFARSKNGSWKAEEGKHDDRVMSVIWALMILHNEITEEYFEIEKLDDHGKPLEITDIDMGLGDYMVSNSLYNDLDGTSDPTVQPVMFTQSSESDTEYESMVDAGWVPVAGGVEGLDSGWEEYDPAMEKYFL